MEDLLDRVASGESPRDVLDEAVTKGMQKAYARMSPVMQCSNDDCNVTLPKYTGRYPIHCPACGSPIVKTGQKTKPGSMAEAVRVDTTDFEFSHSKKPKGTGNWAFSFDTSGGKSNPKDLFFAQGSYASALKAAKLEAKKRNASVIYTMG